MDKVISFIQESKTELKKVQWPTKKEAIRLTLYVVAISFGVGLFVMGFDYLFKELLSLLLASK